MAIVCDACAARCCCHATPDAAVAIAARADDVGVTDIGVTTCVVAIGVGSVCVGAAATRGAARCDVLCVYTSINLHAAGWRPRAAIILSDR